MPGPPFRPSACTVPRPANSAAPVKPGQFLRIEFRRREADIQSLGDADQGLTGEESAAENIALQGAGERLDAEFFPVVADQLEGIHFRRKFPGTLDDDFHRTAVRQQADIVQPALVETKLVEQLVGRLDVMAHPGFRVLVLEQGRRFQNGIAAHFSETEVELLVQFVAVQAERKRTPETYILIEILPDGVGNIEVGVKGNRRRGAVTSGQNAIDLLLLTLFEERVVVEAEIACLQVALPCPGFCRNQIGRAHQQHDLVDIGQLLTVLVDPMVVRVAIEFEAFGRSGRRVPPRLQGRHFRIFRPVLAAKAGVDCGPVTEASLLDQLGQGIRIGIFLMILLHEVRRLVDIGRRSAGQAKRKCGIRIFPGVANRVFVDDLELRRLAVGEQDLRQSRARKILVVGDVLEIVAEILRGKRNGRPTIYAPSADEA